MSTERGTRRAESQSLHNSAKTLVCFALKEEVASFRKIAKRKPGVRVLITGIGRMNATSAVNDALNSFSPHRLFTCGFAGGLDPALTSGTVVFSTDDARLREQLLTAGVKLARFVCVPRIATMAAEKQELCRTTGADAVEMESEAIHAICRERGIACATVRVISDTAGDDLPLDFNQIANPDLSLHHGKLALAIIKSPQKIPALLQLQKNCRLAAERLAEVLGNII